MAEQYYITLKKIIEDFDLEIIHLLQPAEDVHIVTNEVNRPGIVLTGYTDYFDPLRIQILGWTELGFLQNMSDSEQKEALGKWLSLHPAAVVITRGLEIPQCMIEACEKYDVPLLKTQQETSPFLSALIAELNRELAPRITRHGVLVEVYGEGVLIVGESGAGKSETAIELIKRGHRLIADDAVEIRKVSYNTLEGSSPSNIRHFIELRGIGIINARRIFGMGAVKPKEKIDMVVQLEEWDATKAYDRLGLDNEYTRLLEVKVPVITVPITPGRNLAVIVETAAMNNRQKKMGYNGAKELMHNLGIDDVEPTEKELELWANS
ncbi:HPr(Ser) kinase/phosphatase [uncultured Eubacterium sp.]|uniref:HPr(Ser) kinase/phosphatase n=1 Tax=uncultured Eubacterium sp. TaxID=165185 RepID=UPI0025EB095C|nr:HPr(Ser) kinase/phosphatase [uncultured Eubacterium sp.]